MIKKTTRWLIATDLENTLLGSEYTAKQVASVVDRISRLYNARICLVSNKTLAEMVSLASQCETAPALIFENGAGVAAKEPLGFMLSGISGRYKDFHFQVQGQSYGTLRDTLANLRAKHGYEFLGFGDLSTMEIADMAGLSTAEAELASQRLVSEPIRWYGNAMQLEEFSRHLAVQGFWAVRSAKFVHVVPASDKSVMVTRLALSEAETLGTKPRILTCGDAENDRQMLQAADRSIVFPDTKGGYLLPESEQCFHAREAGPAEWFHQVSNVLGDPEESLYRMQGVTGKCYRARRYLSLVG